MKKKGFTLIEVLGVIVVLAVIALITTPIIMNVIEKGKKGALEDSAYGLLEAANIYYSQGILTETTEKTEFTFKDGVQTSTNKLSYKGKVENGSVRLFSDGKSALCITGGNYAAVKNVNDQKVTMVKGRCRYNTETEEYETVGLCQDLQDEIDELKKKHQEELDKLREEYEEKLKQAELDKEKIIKDYEDKIKTITDAYEAQIKELTDQLNVFKNGGTATADQILSGKTAFVKGQLITGTILSRGAVTYTPTTSNQIITAGQYLSGIQTIKGDSNLQASNIKKGISLFGITGTYTSDANATAAGILAGQTAYVNGNKITGTMINRGAVSATVNAGQIYTIPEGYHNGSGTVTGTGVTLTTSGETSGSITLAMGKSGSFTMSGTVNVPSGQTVKAVYFLPTQCHSNNVSLTGVSNAKISGSTCTATISMSNGSSKDTRTGTVRGYFLVVSQ